MSVKRAVIFGSNGGIGSAVVRKLFENNYDLCLFSRTESKLNESIDQLRRQSTSNQRIDGCPIDVCDSKSIESSIKYLRNQNQLPISDLIICAGVNKDKLLLKETDSNIEHILQTNLISTLNICKQFSRLMIKHNEQSSIILIGNNVANNVSII